MVRAMAMVYLSFFRPLSASFWMLGACLSFLHAWLETAALDHEALDHAVEHGVFVVAGLDVLDEVGHGDRGFFGVQFDDDVAVVGGQFDFGHA
jgi:hypothetical protein